MGSISNFYIGSYDAFASKNSYAEDIVNLIFTVDDYKEIKIENGDGHSLDKGLYSTAKICISRLECQGVTWGKVREEYEKVRCKYYENDISLHAEFGHTVPKFEELDFENYLALVKEIIDNNIPVWDADKYSNIFKKDLIEHCCFFSDNYQEECQSTANHLYVLLNSVSEDTVVYYDLTSVIDNGWVDSNPSKLISNDKIIILTEGKTDTEFIKNSIELFYPYLSRFYHFINYEETKTEGSASILVNSIKSFVGSGIKNRIIALFDNDTVGNSESKKLHHIKLPENIKVLKYPELRFFREYPTIVPSGRINMNVNGLAGNIEMYLGEDVLKDDALDEFYPIYWSNYDFKMCQYQGSINHEHKLSIQEKFRGKLKEASSNDTDINNTKWNGIKSILKIITEAWK